MTNPVIIGNATLYHGDCLEILPTLDNVDAVIADPPYFQVKQDSWDNQWKAVDDFLRWADEVGLLIKSKLAFNGSLYWFCSPQMSGRVESVMRRHFNILSNIVWNKGGTRKGAAGTGIDVTSLRTFWTANTERIIFAEHYGSDYEADGEVGYTSACETTKQKIVGDYLKSEFDRAGVKNKQIAELFPSKTGGITGCVSNWLTGANFPTKEQYEEIRKFLNQDGGEYLKREYEDLRRPFNATPDDQWGDIWDFSIERLQLHSTQKPEKLMLHILKISSKPDQIILDPFMGSGTTGVACMNLERKFIGIEIEKKYFDIACERIDQAQRQQRLAL